MGMDPNSRGDEHPGGMNIHNSQMGCCEVFFGKSMEIDRGKRGLPLYPLKEGAKQDPTVVIAAGQHLQLQRWRRFQTNAVAWQVSLDRMVPRTR